MMRLRGNDDRIDPGATMYALTREDIAEMAQAWLREHHPEEAAGYRTATIKVTSDESFLILRPR